MKKKIAAIITLLTFTVTTAHASILGGLLLHEDSINIGKGLNLYNNIFLSDQTGVGNQTEYYAEYVPNEDVIPTVITGEEIYGKRTAKEIMEYMKQNGMVPMLGINASFFSLSTGIPMGHVITDGVVTSKDNRNLQGVGFMKDGTAFVEDLCIETTVSFGEDYVLQIPHINKLISKETQMVTLYTSDFGEKTGTQTNTINVVLENVTDELKIGGEFTCTVKEIVTSDAPLLINENEMIISVNSLGNQWGITLINAMQVGEELTVKTTATSEKWNDAYNGLASEGARLLNNGEVNPNLEAGAAPRTAVGIKEDNTVVFYVLDGRQKGYSYGAKQSTVAERLKELGCVDAINLDGGGSTTMMGVYPGCDEDAIINSPSDGVLRKVTNFIFLKNMQKPTGNPAYAYIYPYSGNILSGSTISLETKVADDNYYPVDVSALEYSSNEYATITPDGKLTALGEGTITAEVLANGVTGKAEFKSYLYPDEIKLYNADNSKEITDIDAIAGDTFRFYAKAFYKGLELMSSKDAYRWSVSGDNATVNKDGVLEISPYAKSDMILSVKAGAFSKDYKIKLPNQEDNPELYPKTQIDVSDNVLTVTMSSNFENIDVLKSFIRIDGKKISISDCEITSTDDKNITLKYQLDEGTHRIYCQTELINGYTDISSYKIESDETQGVFSDTASHWAKNIISYMNLKGVVNGSIENGELVYRPDNNVTRAEFAIMVSNFMNYVTEHYNDVSLEIFEDANDIPKWALPQIKAVYKNGIINGKDNNDRLYFEPNSYITRAEAATIISRILPKQIIKNDVSFIDKDQIPFWANEAFMALTASGLINGYDDNTVKPNNNVTRAEAVTMFYNIY